MRGLLAIFTLVVFGLLFGGVTGPQVNEPVKIGIEKIAYHPPGSSIVAHAATPATEVLACNKCMYTEFRLVAGYEKTSPTSKPCALVMCTSVTPYAVVNCPFGSDRLFLPGNERQNTKYCT